MNAASLANLELGNIPGKPKPNAGNKPAALKILTHLDEELEKPYNIYAADSPSHAQEIARQWVHRSLKDQNALDKLLDRKIGPVVQKHEITEVRVVEAMARIISAYVPLELQPQAIKQLVSEIKTFDVPQHLLESDSGSNAVPDAESTSQPDSDIAIPGPVMPL